MMILVEKLFSLMCGKIRALSKYET